MRISTTLEKGKLRELKEYFSRYGTYAKCVRDTKISRDAIVYLLNKGTATKETVDTVVNYVEAQKQEAQA